MKVRQENGRVGCVNCAYPPSLGRPLLMMFLLWLVRLLQPLDMSLEDPSSSSSWSNWSFSTESIDQELDTDTTINHEEEEEESSARFRSFSKPEKRRNSVEEDGGGGGFGGISSANKKAAFRKSFDSAVHAVFHSRNGLPLTSSPAPMRRGIKFDFDSGINTPKVRTVLVPSTVHRYLPYFFFIGPGTVFLPTVPTFLMAKK